MQALAIALSVLLAAPETVEPQKTDRTDHVRIGAIGGLGFPRPLEGMVRIERTIGLGLESVASVTLSESMAVETWFVNPRVGVLFTWKPGFTIGIDAGVQLPVAVTTTSTLPISVLPAEVTSAANALGGSVLPTVDLLRIGFLL